MHPLVLCFQLAVLVLVGRAVAQVLPTLRQPAPASSIPRWLHSLAQHFTFGAGAAGLLLGALGHWRYDALSMTVPLALLAVAGAVFFWKDRAKELDVNEPKTTRLEQGALALLAIAAAINLLGVFSPEVRHDPLFYHLQVPQLWLNFGRLVEVPENGHSYFPYGFEVLYGWSLALGSDSAAKGLHWACGLAAACWTARLATSIGARPAYAAALIYLVPTMGYLSSTTYIDLATAMFAVAAMALLFERNARPTIHADAITVGLLAGCAMATKYTAWPLVGVPVVLAVGAGCLARKEGARVAAISVIIAGLAAAVPLLPWTIRNIVYIGNPVAPLMVSVFGPESAARTGLAGAFDSFAGQSHGLAGWLLAPPAYAMHLLTQKYILSLLGLFAGAASLFVRDENRARRSALLALLAALFLFEAAFTRGHPDGRYGFASMAAGAALIAALCRCLGAARAELLAPVLILATFATSLLDRSRLQQDLGERWLPILSEGARREYAETAGLPKDFDAIESALESANAGRVIGWNYPSRRRYWIWIQGMRNDFVDAAGPAPTAETIRAAVLRHGATHIVSRTNPGFGADAWGQFLELHTNPVEGFGERLRTVR